MIKKIKKYKGGEEENLKEVGETRVILLGKLGRGGFIQSKHSARDGRRARPRDGEGSYA
jgi:hypothetical protein